MSHVADMDILLEEEADKQRVVEENQLAEYLAIVKQKRDEEKQAREVERRAARKAHELTAREGLAYDLKVDLAISVPLERVFIVETGDFGEWYPAVNFGGVTFAKPRVNLSYLDWREREEVYVARPCAKCGHDMWILAGSPTRLLDVLEDKHQHDGNCLQPVDDEEPTSVVRLSVFEVHARALERYTEAVRIRRNLEFARPATKEMAVQRILCAGGIHTGDAWSKATSVSAAEKVVEFDEPYAAHCRALSDAVLAEITTREQLAVARHEAGLQIVDDNRNTHEE